MTYVGREIQKIGSFSVNFKWHYFTPQKRQKTESNLTWLHKCETKNHKNMHKELFLTFDIDFFYQKLPFKQVWTLLETTTKIVKFK